MIAFFDASALIYRIEGAEPFGTSVNRSRPDLIWIELTQTVVELATVIRTRHGLRTPDALQAACCLQLDKGHIFLTGDDGFKRVDGLNVKLLH